MQIKQFITITITITTTTTVGKKIRKEHYRLLLRGLTRDF